MIDDNHFCSVEYARKLNELGISKSFYERVEYFKVNEKPETLPIFTIGELFDRLPALIDTEKDEPFNNFFLHVRKRIAVRIGYTINYYCDTYKPNELGDPHFSPSLIQTNIYDEKLADALAQMLIALIEKGYVKV